MIVLRQHLQRAPDEGLLLQTEGWGRVPIAFDIRPISGAFSLVSTLLPNYHLLLTGYSLLFHQRSVGRVVNGVADGFYLFAQFIGFGEVLCRAGGFTLSD